MPENHDPHDTVYTHAQQTAHGYQEVHVTLTPDADKRKKVLMVAPPFVIPIVFVPGVMGSNLKKKTTGTRVWRPPNGLVDELSTLGNFYFRMQPKDRQMLFDPSNAEVDTDGPVDTGTTGLSEAVLKGRGWGSVHLDSYGEILARLHTRFNSPIDMHTLLPSSLGDYMHGDPALWGSVSGSQPLTPQDIRSTLRYRFEIWACGYNWLQSNEASGQDLYAFIQNTLKKYANPGGRPVAQKVILVTHSMGGLVARAMLKSSPEAASKVLGVIHSVQPAAGAPAVYKRARAGFEGMASGVFGVNAIEALPELANSPALLEMLPFASYNGGKPWLSTSNPKHLSLPKNGNPFTEIYLSTAWYGLVPEQHTAYMDPAGLVAQQIGRGKSVRKYDFEPRLKTVDAFQKAIDHYGYHPQTHVHCSVEQSHKSWGHVRWEGYIAPDVHNLEACHLKHDNQTGRIELAGVASLSLSGPDQAGDGTVPALSALAPYGRPGVQSLFVHGQGTSQGMAELATRRTTELNAKATQPGYIHQKAFLDERAQWATVYGIVQLAKLADWAG